ncbi:hypothetical protein CHS0354_006376 [Potamilus streckersoni]|uniref:Uncharacterized protein n=1 Tax=Potamilus streckersoni TaxID=2493646 RepID=A0AAE0SFF2_9BIVA|nr:hypothetical protein CHS0354_006376 [Potamilus streckersoni]
MSQKTSKVLAAILILALLVDASDGVSWKCIVAGAGAGAVSVVAAPLVLSAVGFTATGVAAGSMAAVVQAGIGNVAVGSTFAALQSAGAVGLAATTKFALGTTVATMVGSASCTLSSVKSWLEC